MFFMASGYFHRWHAIIGIICLTMLILMPTAHGATGDRVVLTGPNWLNGYGVDVIYPPYQNAPGPQETYGIRYQCVELIQRLYAQKLGYPDRWGVSYASQMEYKAGQPGFADLQFIPNGSTQPPQAGDIIVTGGNPGHVSVVNRIIGNQLEIVQQNGWTGTPPAPWFLWKPTLNRDTQGRYSIAGQRGWLHSPRMSRLLDPPNQPPRIPAQTAPAPNSALGSRTVSFQWQDAGDPDNSPHTYRDYYTEVWKIDNSWRQALSWTTATSWTITVPSDGQYAWHVKAGDGALGSDWSSTWNFNVDTNRPPNTPKPISPADGSYVNSRTLALQWQDAGDPDNGPRTYRDYYAEIWKPDSSWQQTLSWTTATNWSVVVPSDGTYQWRVRAGDGAAGSTWSGPWQVVIDTIAPGGSTTINNGAETSDSLNVPITLDANDIGSGVREVRLSNDGMAWGTWHPMVNQVWRRLDGEHRGTATIYVQYRDAAGNISSPVSDSIGLNFYTNQPSSAQYRVARDVVAMNGGVHESVQYQVNGTSGQSLASGNVATSSRYQATLGYWNGYASDPLPPYVDPDRPSSSQYRMPKAVIAMNGGSKQSAHYQIHGTSGQPLASSSFANSPRYKARLGFWP